MYKSESRDKCPYCGTLVKFELSNSNPVLTSAFLKTVELFDGGNKVLLACSSCPHCKRLIITLNDELMYPLRTLRTPCPIQVPIHIKKDYDEACMVEPLSSNASAALARRCLQNMLRDVGIKPSDLSNEIEEAMKTLPSDLARAIDAIRLIGNFSAHPMKSTSTGEIVGAEEGETEWVLDVLESLFDHYYVRPALLEEKRNKLNAKLADIQKKPMKG